MITILDFLTIVLSTQLNSVFMFGRLSVIQESIFSIHVKGVINENFK